MTDTVENVELRSLQHLGAYMVSLARHFGSTDMAVIPQEPSRVYYNLFRWAVVEYSGALVIPFAALALLLFAAVLVIGFRGKLLAFQGIRVGVLAASLSVLGGHLNSMLLREAVNALIHPPVTSMVADFPYNANLFALSFVACTIAFCAWLFIRFRDEDGAESLAAAGLVWWAMGTLFTAVAMPGGSYLFTFPLAFGALGLAFRLYVGVRRWG